MKHAYLKSLLHRPEHRHFRSFLLFAVLSVLLASGAVGQQLNIAEVSIEGNRTASSNLILSVASFNIGDNISPSTIPNAVKRLYGLGFFSDIQIDAEEVVGGVNQMEFLNLTSQR